jgi:hypothetical protein
MPLLDISNRPIAGDAMRSAGAPAGSPPVISIPPANLAPNAEAQEFLFTGSSLLALGGTTFIQLTDTDTGNAFARVLPADYRAKISSILVYCGDMTAATTPYLFFRILINDQPSTAWSNIPIFPRSGTASLSFNTEFNIQPGAKITAFAMNQDPGAQHLVGMYLQGWQWPA